MENTDGYERHEARNWSSPQRYAERNDNSVASTPHTGTGYFVGSTPTREQPCEASPPSESSPYEAGYPNTSPQMLPSIPQGFWFCSECRNPNNEALAFSQCAICDHRRCQSCRGAGEACFEDYEQHLARRSRSQGTTRTQGTAHTSPNIPHYSPREKSASPAETRIYEAHEAPEAVYPTARSPMAPYIPQGFWYCSGCRNSNNETLAPSHCSTCGHRRCDHCRSAGQDYFEETEGQFMNRSRSGAGATLRSPNIPSYSPREKDSLKERVEPTTRASATPNKKFGMRRNCFYLLLFVILVWVIALGVGLGLGLSLGLKRHRSASKKIDPYCRAHPEVCIGGALDKKYFSKKGAFNGSGIALAGESWNKEQRKIFTIYFQHWTGDLRFMQYTTDRKWIGGGKAQTVATDAKNSTPLSTVAYSVNSTQVFHLFYVSKNDTLRQMTMTNVSNIWEPGPLSDLNLNVWDVPSVGLQACWKGNFYGDSDYTKFPTESGLPNDIPFEERLGMNIWYPIDENTFQQYTWYQGSDQWVALDKWQGMNGHAGVGCYSWGEGTTTYTLMVNKDNITEIWWKDTNSTLPSEDTHPINSWKNSSAAIGNVYPATSLGYTTFLFAQMADKSVRGFNVSFHAENTTVVEEDTFTITDPAGPVYGLGGTHLTNTAYAEKEGDKVLWDSLYVFYQTVGDDITAFTRPIAGGEWTKGDIKIPLE